MSIETVWFFGGTRYRLQPSISGKRCNVWLADYSILKLLGLCG